MKYGATFSAQVFWTIKETSIIKCINAFRSLFVEFIIDIWESVQLKGGFVYMKGVMGKIGST